MSLFFRSALRDHGILHAIWYDLHSAKNVQNTLGGVLHLVKLQSSALVKVTLPHGFFFTFFKLYKLYQIGQSITYRNQLIVNKSCEISTLFSFCKRQDHMRITQDTCSGFFC